MTAPDPSPPASPTPRRLRAALAPVRFALRRPARAALYLTLALVAAALVASVGVRVWFERSLAAARTEVARGHNAAAVAHLRRCAGVSPDHPEVLLLSARVARRSGAWDEAAELLDRRAERHGEDGGSIFERLLLRAARGELEETGAAVRARVRAGGPDADLAREALVTGLIYRFRWGEALVQLDEWLAADPNATAALLLRGKLEEQRRALGPAAGYYRRIVEADPEHDEARLRLTTLLLADRHGAEALDHLSVLRNRLPGHAEVGVQWARALALVGRADESRAALAECLATNPDYAPALAERGAQAMLDGKEEDAVRDLARAVDLDPGNVTTNRQYAFALARSGRRADAAREDARVEALKADLERITVLISGPLQERPNDPAVHHEIALIAIRSGQVAEAIRWFEGALRVDPNHAPTHLALAGLYRALGKPGLEARHRALAARPESPGR